MKSVSCIKLSYKLHKILGCIGKFFYPNSPTNIRAFPEGWGLNLHKEYTIKPKYKYLWRPVYYLWWLPRYKLNMWFQNISWSCWNWGFTKWLGDRDYFSDKFFASEYRMLMEGYTSEEIEQAREERTCNKCGELMTDIGGEIISEKRGRLEMTSNYTCLSDECVEWKPVTDEEWETVHPPQPQIEFEKHLHGGFTQQFRTTGRPFTLRYEDYLYLKEFYESDEFKKHQQESEEKAREELERITEEEDMLL